MTATKASLGNALRRCVAAMALGICMMSAAHATEGGGGAYPNGAEDFLSGALPPPGTYLINYFTHYSADRFNGNDGSKAPFKFELDATADVIRLIHVTDKTILGASWAMHLFVPVANVDVTTPGGNQSRLGIGDLIVDPFILGWHSRNLHAAAGVDIYIPTGAKASPSMPPVGRNYWTFEPVVGVTYLSDSGLDVSAKMMYDINTINSTTDYTSGDEFHMDFAVGQKIGKYTFGAAGYYYQQVTDDMEKGVKKADSKGSAVAIGPVFKYDYQKTSFTLKYLFETEVSNRPEGGSFWFKVSHAF